MPSFGYDADDLRAAGRCADEAAAAAARARDSLGVAVAGTPFGAGAAAAGLLAAVCRAHDAHTDAARLAASTLGAQARRAIGAAVLGDLATAETVRLASPR